MNGSSGIYKNLLNPLYVSVTIIQKQGQIFWVDLEDVWPFFVSNDVDRIQFCICYQ